MYIPARAAGLGLERGCKMSHKFRSKGGIEKGAGRKPKWMESDNLNSCVEGLSLRAN